MREGQILAKSLALVLSVLSLSGLILVLSPQAKVELAGAGIVHDARLGSTFKDLSAGVLTAAQSQNETPSPARPELQAKIPQSAVRSGASGATPRQDAALVSPLRPIGTTQAVSAPETVSSNALLPTTPTASLQTGVASLPEAGAPSLSARPKQRNPVLAAKAAPESLQQTPKAKRGNAHRDATKGTRAGTTRKATAKVQGTANHKASQNGSAAASNYPGQVMRRISRVPKPRTAARGVAVVAFSISAGGGLAQLSVTRSSGSAALDKAALAVIRKAAPFPKPPAGAKRRFSIKIKGR